MSSLDSVPLRNGYTPSSRSAWHQQHGASHTDAHGEALSVHNNELAMQAQHSAAHQMEGGPLAMASGTASPSLSPSQSPAPSARGLPTASGASAGARNSVANSSGSQDDAASSPGRIPALHEDAAIEPPAADASATSVASSASPGSVWDRAYITGRNGATGASKGSMARQGSAQLPFGRASRSLQGSSARASSQAGRGPSVSRRPAVAKARGKDSAHAPQPKAWA